MEEYDRNRDYQCHTCDKADFGIIGHFRVLPLRGMLRRGTIPGTEALSSQVWIAIRSRDSLPDHEGNQPAHSLPVLPAGPEQTMHLLPSETWARASIQHRLNPLLPPLPRPRGRGLGVRGQNLDADLTNPFTPTSLPRLPGTIDFREHPSTKLLEWPPPRNPSNSVVPNPATDETRTKLR